MDADQLDLKITGHVVTPGRVLEDGWIGVRGEIVAGLGPAGSAAPAARQVIGARGQWILPGAVDAHVHCFSEPAEGFTHATRAAAAGGVTTIIEMPYDAEAPVVAGDVLDRKKDRLRREAVVDVALLGTIRKSGGLDAVGELAAGGVCGFKASMFETDPIEVARALREAGAGLRHPLEVIDFLGEEPNDFGLSMVGSRTLAGTLDPAGLQRQDLTGRSLADAIGSAGGDPGRLADVRRAPGSVACYLELHIEQGRRLEQAGCPLGVVTAITGVTRYRIELQGRADHAGGTPMAERCDALAAAVIRLDEELAP